MASATVIYLKNMSLIWLVMLFSDYGGPPYYPGGMKNLSRNLNVILLTGIVFAIFLTWLGPIVIGILFTPPVSFGVNCEPAAAWSMHKLIYTQSIGLVVGCLVSGIFMSTRKTKAPLETKS